MKREDRKRQLIAQGAVYRAEVLLARQAAQDGLKPDTLARSILHQAAGAAFAAFRNRRASGDKAVNLQAWLPIVMGGISALSRRKPLLKTILRVMTVATTAAGLVAAMSKKKKPKQDGPDEA